MPNPFENPFLPEKKSKNDDAEFLQEFAGATSEQLERAGVSPSEKQKQEDTEDTPPLDSSEVLQSAATDEENEAYLNELMEFYGFELRRKDIIALESVKKQLNADRLQAGLDPVEFGDEELKITAAEADGRIRINENTESVEMINLFNSPIASLENVQLPEGLRKLGLFNTPISSLENVSLPDGLKKLDLSNTQITSLDNVHLPVGLEGLYLGFTEISSLDNVLLPEGLQELHLHDTSIPPSDIKQLKIKYPHIEIVS